MVQRLKSIAEWYLGVAPSGSGESARWSLRLGAVDALTPWVIAAMAVIAVLILLREPDRSSRRWRRLLALRLSALAIIAVWFAELTLHVVRTGLPTLVLLVDTSASMGLDDQPEERAAGPAARAAARSDPAGRTRLEVGQRLLLGNDGALLRDLARRYRLHVYEFSDAARQVGHTTSDADLVATEQAIATLTPGGDETRPGLCLDQVLSEFRGAPPAAALVFTDGIASLSDSEKLSAAQQPSALGVPVFAVALGSTAPALDLEIFDLQVDPIVFVGDTVAVEFTARGFGLENREVEFLLQLDGDPDVLARTTTVLDGDTPTPVRLPLTPVEEGTSALIVTARPIAGEANRENNVLRRTVQVRRDQIRVLLAERSPRWEYRHLKSLLERDTNVELRTVLQESDLEHQREDRTALPGFPATQDDLFAYDVLILGDLDLQFLNPGTLESIRDFVGRRGGGLILIAGERHNPDAFRSTPLEPLVPVELADVRRPTAALEFTVVPARSGADHPLLRLGGDSPSTEFWNQLPKLHWSVEARLREPAGVAVASRSASPGAAPVLALQRYGAGQVLFHATDELWRWRRRVEDRYYGRYWRQAVRFVCRSRRLQGSGDAELSTDRNLYTQGEAVRFRLKLLDETSIATAVQAPSVLVERGSGKQLSVMLTASPDAPGEYHGILPEAPAGEYHAWVASALETTPSCDFTVALPRRELLRQAADSRDLQQATRRSGGDFVAVADAAGLPDRLPRGETASVLSNESIALWARGEWLVLFVALLSAEWLLRRGL